MSSLDAQDPSALEAALDGLPVGTWVEVTTARETFRLRRVPGGWYLPGDVVVASGDVVDGRPESVRVLNDADEKTLLPLGDSDPEEAAALRAVKEPRWSED